MPGDTGAEQGDLPLEELQLAIEAAFQSSSPGGVNLRGLTKRPPPLQSQAQPHSSPSYHSHNPHTRYTAGSGTPAVVSLR